MLSTTPHILSMWFSRHASCFFLCQGKAVSISVSIPRHLHPPQPPPHFTFFEHAVLACDFLSSLADNAKEFRVLLNYLKYLKQHPAAVEEARQVAAQAAQYGGIGSSFLQSVQWQQKLGAPSKRHLQRRLLEDVTLTAADKASLIPAEFDPSQHSGLIEELKRLYVAVTRAKSNVSCVGAVSTAAGRLGVHALVLRAAASSAPGWRVPCCGGQPEQSLTAAACSLFLAAVSCPAAAAAARLL